MCEIRPCLSGPNADQRSARRQNSMRSWPSEWRILSRGGGIAEKPLSSALLHVRQSGYMERARTLRPNSKPICRIRDRQRNGDLIAPHRLAAPMMNGGQRLNATKHFRECAMTLISNAAFCAALAPECYVDVTQRAGDSYRRSVTRLQKKSRPLRAAPKVNVSENRAASLSTTR